jgi:prepilin-type N-terminal cleavage/methylation domain-containing protein
MLTVPRSIRAFTLPELVASIVIVSAIAAVLAPVLLTSTDAYARATTQRSASEDAGAAMDRLVRTIRRVPAINPGFPEPDITTADSDHLVFVDGHEVELIGTTLWFTAPGQAPSPLCQNVEVFTLSYIGADGVTDTSSDPKRTQRCHIRLVVSGFELQTAVFLRIAMEMT